MSHKSRDRIAAAKLKDLLLNHGRGLIQVFVSEENVKPGDQWRPQLWEHLAASHLLILLFTAPGDNWNWCLFETGFFVGKHQAHTTARGVHRLVCLHPANIAPPRPLEHWQSVPSESENVRQFLRELFQGINPDLIANNQKFAELVEQVIAIVGKSAPVPEEHYFTFDMTLILTRHEMLDLKEKSVMQETVRVEAPARTWEEVFGLQSPGPEGRTWGKFVELLALEAQRLWTQYLPIAIGKLNDFQAFSPVLPLLCRRDWDGGLSATTYRPIICQRVRLADEWTSFRIVLGRTPDAPAREVLSSKLFHLLFLSQHLSCEALPRCRRQLEIARRMGKETEAKQALREAAAELLFVRVEAMNRGIQVGSDVYEVFDKRGSESFGGLMDRWRTANEAFRKASEATDMSQAAEALSQMQEISSEFVQSLATRFAEVSGSRKP